MRIGTLLLLINDKNSVLDDAIKLFSGGKAHTACYVGNDEVFEMNCPKGAIIRPLSDYKVKRFNVLIAEPLFLTASQCDLIAIQLRSYVKEGIKYDYKGILGQLLRIPNKFNDKERMYCSEAVGYAYKDIADYLFMELEPEEQTPSDQAYDVECKQKMWELGFLKRG